MSKIHMRAGIARGLFLLAVLFGAVAAGRATPPLSVYGNLPGFEAAAMSQSGDHVAVVGVLGEKRSLVVMDKNKKPQLVVGIEPGTRLRSLSWVGDAMVLVETAAVRKLFGGSQTELFAMLVVPLDGGKPWSVFANDPTIRGGVRGAYGVNVRDGKYFGYFSAFTRENAPGAQFRSVLYEVDLQTQAAKPIALSGEGIYTRRSWLVSTDGVASVTFDYQTRDGSWRITNDQGRKIASGVQSSGVVSLVGFGNTPGTVVYQEQEEETGALRFFEVPIAGGAAKEIAGELAIRCILYDGRTRSLVGYGFEGDRQTYKLFDPFRAKVAAATQKAFPDRQVALLDWNEKFDRLIVLTEGVGEPPTWWLVDIKTGNADVLGTSYPVSRKDIGPVRMISYKASDGLGMSAVLTLPPGREAKNLPVVVLPHGGPATRDYPTFDWWAQAFAARGYAVLQPNYRGSAGYGAEFVRAGYGEWGRKMQSDISDGLTELVREGIADPKRACIVGARFGGYAALAGVTLQHGLYRCAAAFSAISDLPRGLASATMGSGYDPTLIRRIKKEIGAGRDLAAVSPIRFADQADAPILLIESSKDDEQSHDMAAALRRANKPVELVTLPEWDYWLSTSETRLAMLQATVAFVEKHNPPDAPTQ